MTPKRARNIGARKHALRFTAPPGRIILRALGSWIPFTYFPVKSSSPFHELALEFSQNKDKKKRPVMDLTQNIGTKLKNLTKDEMGGESPSNLYGDDDHERNMTLSIDHDGKNAPANGP